MRICHVVYSYYPQEVRPRRAGKLFNELGNEVHVIAMREKGEPVEETVEGLHVHRIPFSIVRGGRLRYLYQYLVFFMASSVVLFWLQLTRRFDVVHVHSLPDFQVLCALPERLWGTRIVIDLHEAMPELFAARFHLAMSSWEVRLALAVEMMSCIAADHVLVVNDTMKRRLLARGFPEQRITVVMNSPDLAEQRSFDVTERVRELNLTDGPAIVYLGGVNPERDLETLVKAVALVNERHRLKLTIIGHGDPGYSARLQRLVNDLGLRDCTITGRVPHWQTQSYIGLSILGPITYERNPLTEIAMPTKALEYAAAGKPLIIANLGTIREIFGEAALYYQPADSRDLARQIQWVLENPQGASELVGRAMKVVDRCSWGTMRSRLIEVYQSLANQGADRHNRTPTG